MTAVNTLNEWGYDVDLDDLISFSQPADTALKEIRSSGAVTISDAVTLKALQFAN